MVELILFRRNRLYVLELLNLSVSFLPIVEKKIVKFAQHYLLIGYFPAVRINSRR